MEFLRRVRKFVAAVEVGETVLLPAFVGAVSPARGEMLIIIERTTTQQYTFVIIQTSSSALRYHPVSPTHGPPKLKYRTALVLPNISKKVRCGWQHSSSPVALSRSDAKRACRGSELSVPCTQSNNAQRNIGLCSHCTGAGLARLP
jgi:hypothetical protein